MTDTTVVAIVASVMATIAPTIAALAAYRQAKKSVVATEKNDEKTDTIIDQVEVVRVLTNGNLEKLKAELAVVQKSAENAAMQIANLQALVALLVKKPPETGDASRIAELKSNEQKSEDRKE